MLFVIINWYYSDSNTLSPVFFVPSSYALDTSLTNITPYGSDAKPKLLISLIISFAVESVTIVLTSISLQILE